MATAGTPGESQRKHDPPLSYAYVINHHAMSETNTETDDKYPDWISDYFHYVASICQDYNGQDPVHKAEFYQQLIAFKSACNPTEWTPDEPLYRDFLGHDRAGNQVLVTVWHDGTCWVQQREDKWSTWQAPIVCRLQ